jgi:hypothetical protein
LLPLLPRLLLLQLLQMLLLQQVLLQLLFSLLPLTLMMLFEHLTRIKLRLQLLQRLQLLMDLRVVRMQKRMKRGSRVRGRAVWQNLPGGVTQRRLK